MEKIRKMKEEGEMKTHEGGRAYEVMKKGKKQKNEKRKNKYILEAEVSEADEKREEKEGEEEEEEEKEGSVVTEDGRREDKKN